MCNERWSSKPLIPHHMIWNDFRVECWPQMIAQSPTCPLQRRPKAFPPPPHRAHLSATSSLGALSTRHFSSHSGVALQRIDPADTFSPFLPIRGVRAQTRLICLTLKIKAPPTDLLTLGEWGIRAVIVKSVRASCVWGTSEAGLRWGMGTFFVVVNDSSELHTLQIQDLNSQITWFHKEVSVLPFSHYLTEQSKLVTAVVALVSVITFKNKTKFMYYNCEIIVTISRHIVMFYVIFHIVFNDQTI